VASVNSDVISSLFRWHGLRDWFVELASIGVDKWPMILGMGHHARACHLVWRRRRVWLVGLQDA
jgi:hypothetical protein